MSAEIDRDIAEADYEDNTNDGDVDSGVSGPGDEDLTTGVTPAQKTANDETRSPEEEGGENPGP